MAKRSEWLDVLLFCLAVWRLSRMVTDEDGPADMFKKIREVAGAELDGTTVQWDQLNSWGKIVQCPYCISVWVAAFFLMLRVLNISFYRAVVLSLTGSAATVLIEEMKQ